MFPARQSSAEWRKRLSSGTMTAARFGVLAAGGTEGAVLAALEGDDAGGVALLEVTFVDLLFLDAELAGPVTPDAADAGIDQPEDEGDD